jgi:hypothetical protein
MNNTLFDKNDFAPYLQAVTELKNAILKSRYTAARLVNKEMLLLYYFVGKYVSRNTRSKNWGKGAIENISAMLQQELHGLRGFSPTNLKNMRIFYEGWPDIEPIFLANTTVPLFDFMEEQIRQMSSDELSKPNRQTISNDLGKVFFSVGFSQHIAILQAIDEKKHQWFYIQKTAGEFWTH